VSWAFIISVFVFCVIAGLWIGVRRKRPQDEEEKQPD
jgi:hypothetical protein